MRSKALGLTLLAGAALALAGCGDSGDQAAATQSDRAATTQVAAAADPSPSGGPPAAFAQCKSCHAVAPDQHGIGPSLHGVHGKKAGSATGYAYSEANRTSGVTWDDPTLDAYLAAPGKAMPGTKMTYAGLKDPAKRKEVIDYLKTLK